MLAYEDVTRITNIRQIRSEQWTSRREKRRGQDLKPRDRLNTPQYCTYHHSYNHDTTDCIDIAQHPRQTSPLNKQWNDPTLRNRLPPRQGQLLRYEEVRPLARNYPHDK